MTVPVLRLLDTNVISEMMLPNPNPCVAGFLDEIASEGIGIAAITIWEILNGIGQLDLRKQRKNVAEQFQRLLDHVFEDRVLDWTVADAEICARIVEEKRRRGEPLHSHLPDAMLAGTAIRCNCIIVTRNEKDFRNSGAKVFNPWTTGIH